MYSSTLIVEVVYYLYTYAGTYLRSAPLVTHTYPHGNLRTVVSKYSYCMRQKYSYMYVQSRISLGK